MTLAEKIHLLRKQSAMTQEQLAERLAITRQTVSKWELGESEPNIAYLLQLSEIFQVTTDHLLKDVPNTPSAVDFPKEEARRSGEKAKLWIGGVLAVLGLVGVLTFWILSIVHPAEGHAYVGGHFTIQTGLQGFLLAWNARGLFWFTVAISVIGLGIIFFPNFWKGGGIEEAKESLEKLKLARQEIDQVVKDIEEHSK